MSEALLVALVGAAGAIIGGISTAYVMVKRLPAQIKRDEADTANVAVDVAGDVLKMLRDATEERIEVLTATVKHLSNRVLVLEEQGKKDNEMIVMLNQRLGAMMKTAERQAKRIQLLQDRIDQLVCIVRQAGLQLPTWAEDSGDAMPESGGS